jgi:cyclic lactone autoinducer peptide
MKKIVQISSFFLSLLSIVAVSSMSWLYFNQPEAPKELLKK